MISDAQKLFGFFRPRPIEMVAVEPWPWRAAGFPYYFTNPVFNEDGRGGYARQYRFDDGGVPYREREGGREYDPLVVARYALKMLAASRRGDPGADALAAAVLPALVASGLHTGAWSRGPAPDAMTGPPSGMTQGVVLSAILRLCGGRPVGDVARVVEHGFDVLERPLEEGGTTSRLHAGCFIEEFPRTPPSHVLNGCIYGLLGVYDVADALGHRGGFALARRVESTLETNVGLFTTPLGWSRYALNIHGHRPLASPHYHRAHVGLARLVAERTGSPSLKGAADRWHAASMRPTVRAASALLKTAETVIMRYVRRLPLRRG